jgi:uncharacterized RDD family membrane protein YckC
MADPGSHYGASAVPPGALTPRTPRGGGVPPAPEELAEWWRRAVAALIDGVILGTLTVGILVALGAGLFGGSGGSIGVWEAVVGVLLATLVFVALMLLYAPVVMARTNGQTVGKILAGCRVVRADGRPVGLLYAMLREVAVKGVLLGIAGSATGGIAYVADFVWPFVDAENRALHDLLVDSRVVRA